MRKKLQHCCVIVKKIFRIILLSRTVMRKRCGRCLSESFWKM